MVGAESLKSFGKCIFVKKLYFEQRSCCYGIPDTSKAVLKVNANIQQTDFIMILK